MKDNKYTIPPILEGWIENLHNPSNPLHIRENYCRMLLSVYEAALTEVTKFRAMQNNYSNKSRSKKKA